VARESKRIAVFHPEFREDLRHWVKADRNTAIRVLDLVEAVMRDPFEGLGKPEPLKYVLAVAGQGVSPRNTGWFTA
jgi:toxin YoeB